MVSERGQFKSGFVALVGRPNVGKSTLLNKLLKKKISIVSRIPQTTRHLVRGVYTDEAAQIVFVDSPGMHEFRDPLAKKLNDVARDVLEDIELILYVIDASRSPGREEERIMEMLIKRGVADCIMVFNKIDVPTVFLEEYAQVWQRKLEELPHTQDPLLCSVTVSAYTGKHVEKLLREIKKYLPLGEQYYDAATLTDFPLTFRVADIIREKLFLSLREEIPHSVAVEVMEIEEKERSTVIQAVIYVNRESQKRIVVGKRGCMLRTVGKEARLQLESLVGRRVFLELWVKVVADWQEKTRILNALGYGSGE